jgi:hypothetical protein
MQHQQGHLSIGHIKVIVHTFMLARHSRHINRLVACLIVDIVDAAVDGPTRIKRYYY